MFLENCDVVVDLLLVVLADALRDPDNIPDLLLLQLHKRVEHAVLELLQEGVLVQVHLVLKKLVLQ